MHPLRIDAHDREPGPLPFVLVRDLGDGNVVLLTNPAEDGPQRLPLVLETVSIGQVEFHFKKTDHHALILGRETHDTPQAGTGRAWVQAKAGSIPAEATGVWGAEH